MPPVDHKSVTREVLLAFWKVHILHHASERPVVGQWILNELRSHGYDISPGTLYPLLKRMERMGWLRCEVGADGGPKAPRFYYLTERGRAVLGWIRELVAELHAEVVAAPTVSKRSRGGGPSPSRKNLSRAGGAPVQDGFKRDCDTAPDRRP
jgi:DNA-binding PadR family transcriptional regulator